MICKIFRSFSLNSQYRSAFEPVYAYQAAMSPTVLANCFSSHTFPSHLLLSVDVIPLLLSPQKDLLVVQSSASAATKPQFQALLLLYISSLSCTMTHPPAQDMSGNDVQSVQRLQSHFFTDSKDPKAFRVYWLAFGSSCSDSAFPNQQTRNVMRYSRLTKSKCCGLIMRSAIMPILKRGSR